MLGLSGKVDPDVIQQLFMKNISPTGEVLARQPRQQERLMSWRRPGRSGPTRRPVRTGRQWRSSRSARRPGEAVPKSVPYFDLTVSAVKSMSVLRASYRVAAMKA